MADLFATPQLSLLSANYQSPPTPLCRRLSRFNILFSSHAGPSLSGWCLHSGFADLRRYRGLPDRIALLLKLLRRRISSLWSSG